MEIVVQLLFHAILAGAVYALIAAGLSFIYATTRVFHLAHGAVVAFSGYVFWFLSERTGWNMILAGLVACVIAVFLGLLMNELVYEPLRRRKTKGLGYLIATIALLLMGNAFIIAIFGASSQSLGVQTEVIEILGARISVLQISIIAIALFFLLLLGFISKRTKFGKAMRATADNEMVTEVLGIKTQFIRRMTFAIGSLLGGIAGILVALEFNLEPNMGVFLVIKGFAGAVIGGVGSMTGAIAGSVLLGGVEQAAVWFWGSGWKSAMAFVLLFLFLLLRPQGLFGKKRFL